MGSPDGGGGSLLLKPNAPRVRSEREDRGCSRGVVFVSLETVDRVAPVTTPHVHTVPSSLSLEVLWDIGLSTGACTAHHFTSSVLPEAAVFSRGFVPVLRRPLQALQRLLRQPHQGPEGPGERYDIPACTQTGCASGIINRWSAGQIRPTGAHDWMLYRQRPTECVRARGWNR